MLSRFGGYHEQPPLSIYSGKSIYTLECLAEESCNARQQADGLQVQQFGKFGALQKLRSRQKRIIVLDISTCETDLAD
jgi:hypothetical protein